MFGLLLLVPHVASQANCGCQTSFEKAVAKSAVVLFGSVVSGAKGKFSLQAIQSYKGCIQPGQTIEVEDPCKTVEPLLLGTYLVTGNFKKGSKDSIITTPCGLLAPWASISPNQTSWLMRKYDTTCASQPCADGSTPLACKPACGTKTQFQKLCPQAETCRVNPCAMCALEFVDKTGVEVCTRLCADGSRPLTCPNNPCTAASPLALLAQGCPQWVTAKQCVPSSCGGCGALWIDAFGRGVCRETTAVERCGDVSRVNFGTQASCGSKFVALGFALLANKCQAIRGCGSSSVPLFATLEQCQLACSCSHLSPPVPVLAPFVSGPTSGAGSANSQPVNFGRCGVLLGYGRINNRCVGVSGCSAQAPPRLFQTLQACTSTCTALENSVKSQLTPRSKCGAGEKEQQCALEPCAIARPPACQDAIGKPLVCVANNCGVCKAVWYDMSVRPASGTRADGMGPGTGMGSVFKCPSNSTCDPLLEPKSRCCPSGFRPLDCSSLSPDCPLALCQGAVRCERDRCAYCAVHFFDSFGNEVTDTCRPVAPSPPPCTGDNCCPSGAPKLSCPPLPVCGKIKCVGPSNALLAVNCTADPCNACAPVLSAQGGDKAAAVSLEQCYVVEPAKCPGTVCPNMTPKCGAVPQACQQLPGLKLSCRMDPCLCVSRWVDPLLGLTPRCVPADWVAPCVEQSQCPKHFSCPPPPPDLPIAPEIQRQLACVQEACTCRPIVTLPKCIPKSQCPSTFTCGLPAPEVVASLPAEVLAQFACAQENCTCRPVLVPPPALLQPPPCTPRAQCPNLATAAQDCEPLYKQLEQSYPARIVRELVCELEDCTCRATLVPPSDSSSKASPSASKSPPVSAAAPAKSPGKG